MKHHQPKRHVRENRVGTHDLQPNLFNLPVAESDAQMRFLNSKAGIVAEYIASLKRQKKLTKSFKPKKAPKHERKKVLQYGLRMRERTTERVVDFVRKPNCSPYHEARIRGNDVEFTNDDVVLIHQKLLWAFKSAFANNWASNSARCMELIVWMTANRPDEPFSFETCCYASDIDPDVIKSVILRKTRERYKSERLHYDVFRQSIMDVERGDPEALKWFNSDDQSEFSFLGLCRLFEFDPIKSKASIRIRNDDSVKVA